jgi:hypothetical protein
MSEKRWFIRVRGRVLGPFNRQQLRTLRERGQFHPFHEISEDRKRWLPASGVAEFFSGEGMEPIAVEEPTSSGGSGYSASIEMPIHAEPAGVTGEWFFVSPEGKQEGPVSRDHLLGLLRQGAITSATLVWKEGLGNWQMLADAGLGILQPMHKSRGIEQGMGTVSSFSPAGNVETALKKYLTDPVGGLPPLCVALGGSRALLLGICLCLIQDFCLLLGTILDYATNHDFPVVSVIIGKPFTDNLNMLLEPGGSHKMAVMMKLVVLAFVPLFSMAGVICFIRTIASGRGQFGNAVLISGAAILPAGLFFPIAVLLGESNTEAILVGYILVGCFIVLILNCGYTRIVGLSDRGALLAVPATLVTPILLEKIIMTSELLNNL